MAQNIEVPFAMQDGKGASEQNSRETLINMYAEADLGRKQLVRRQRPGVKDAVINQSTPAQLIATPQGIERFASVHYFLIGGVLYVRDTAGLFPDSNIGIAQYVDSNAPVTMTFNDNDQIMVCDGTSLAYTATNLLSPAASVATIAGASTCATLAGYGIINEPASSKFYITALNNYAAIDPLDFASAEAFKDNIVRVFTLGNELVLFGETSTEFWAVTGGADFPFAPITNAVIRRGIIGRFAVVGEDNTAFFVAEDGIVYRLEGYRPQRISTHTVERLIEALLPNVRPQCRALVYVHQGSKFVTFTWAGFLTIQYNVATGLWNRAATYGLDHWDLIGSAVGTTDYYLSNRTILCTLDPDQFWDDTFTTFGGTPLLIQRVARSAPGDAGGKRITVPSLTLDVEVGMTEPFNLSTYGGPNALVTEPRIMLRVALDGMSFRNEIWRTLGSLGNYVKQVIWRHLGQGRRPTLELTVSDPCRLTIMGAMAEVEVEP